MSNPPAAGPNALTPSGDDLEERLAVLFAELLEVDRVDRDEDFIEGGGDSLQVVELQERIRQRFKVEIPIMDVVDNSTVALLAERIRVELAKAGARKYH